MAYRGYKKVSDVDLSGLDLSVVHPDQVRVELTKKEHHYEVEATKDVVEEMARYDGATYHLLHFVRLGILNPITDYGEALFYCGDQDEVDSRLVYRWHLTGESPPTVERWLSFGVKVEEVKC